MVCFQFNKQNKIFISEIRLQTYAKFEFYVTFFFKNVCFNEFYPKHVKCDPDTLGIFFELWEKYQYFKEFCNLRINYLSDAKFMIE